ncbi:MAG: hypothetical protein ACRCYU_22935 [Nocardioides sp.]
MLRFLPFLLVFVVAVYFGVRMATKRRPGADKRWSRDKGRGPRRPLGPDDDPDFLRGLGS